MKTLIAYASGTGTTRDCAEILSKLLGNAQTVDLNKEEISPESFDAVIIGAPVRAGRIPKSVRRYMKKYEGVIVGKKCGCFVCCGDSDFEKYLRKNFSKRLLECALSKKWFGAEYRIDVAKGFDKFVCKAAINNYKAKGLALPAINRNGINEMAEELLQ